MPGAVVFIVGPMLLVTVLVRAAASGITRLVTGSWLERYDLIVSGHILSLLLSSFFATVVEVGAVGLAPFPTFGSAMWRSIEMYWLVQGLLLVPDLAFCAFYKLSRHRNIAAPLDDLPLPPR